MVGPPEPPSASTTRPSETTIVGVMLETEARSRHGAVRIGRRSQGRVSLSDAKSSSSSFRITPEGGSEEVGAEGGVHGGGERDGVAVRVERHQVVRALLARRDGLHHARAVEHDLGFRFASRAGSSSAGTSTFTRSGSPTWRYRSTSEPRIVSASTCVYAGLRKPSAWSSARECIASV